MSPLRRSSNSAFHIYDSATAKYKKVESSAKRKGRKRKLEEIITNSKNITSISFHAVQNESSPRNDAQDSKRFFEIIDRIYGYTLKAFTAFVENKTDYPPSSLDMSEEAFFFSKTFSHHYPEKITAEVFNAIERDLYIALIDYLLQDKDFLPMATAAANIAFLDEEVFEKKLLEIVGEWIKTIDVINKVFSAYDKIFLEASRTSYMNTYRLFKDGLHNFREYNNSCLLNMYINYFKIDQSLFETNLAQYPSLGYLLKRPRQDDVDKEKIDAASSGSLQLGFLKENYFSKIRDWKEIN